MAWIQSAFGSKISPAILFIIVVVAAVFFIAALLHLFIRFLVKQRSAQSHARPETTSGSGSFQRQLQQLFHLHDSGLDQSHIDSLPVFLYKEIMGLKEPFDCAVCLCEFSELDKLRLLPICSHAFHIDCIDTWLLSNSTCPLCRGVILSPGFSFENPIFALEESSKEMEGVGSETSGFVGVVKGGDDENSSVVSGKRVFSVRLGKLKSTNVNGGVNIQENEMGESSNSSLDGRRCYSMGSFQYVVADSELQVALCPSGRERKRHHVILDGNVNDVMRVRGGQNRNFTDGGAAEDGKKINSRAKGESFSVSKIWLWSKKGKFHTATHYSNEINASLP
ncbi:RING/U-box superfamily protein [Perilla frutescens var. hirtella]|nr:RING/U-box superfamily protein [Perilla frutescens var. hirtella]KAH6805237.1 RING/U-box superfamily protein [Perilla frutescens var. frutescens]